MLFSELFENLTNFDEVEISGIFTNSQKIIKNGIFVCLEGCETDGHKYAKEAEKNGAAVIVAEKPISVSIPVIYVDDTKKELARLSQRFYNEPAKKLKLIGVTGTNGKTTVTYMIKSILEADGKRVGIIGTNKCYIGSEELKFETDTPTTPDALQLAQIFDIMVKNRVEYVVMEVSSHALDRERVAGLSYDVGVFTNLTRDHLDYHKTMKEYEKAKEKLFHISKVSVINTDTAAGLRIYSKINTPKISVGINEAEIMASRICLSNDNISFFVHENDEEHIIKLGIPGKFSVYNALCAIGAARAASIGYDSISAGLNSMGNVKGRVEIVPTNTPYRVIIDYAHSPDGLFNILNTAKGFTRGRVIALFGCGGDRDNEKRSQMGEVAGKIADFSIITSDNPRTENPVSIIEEIKLGIDRTNGEYIIIVNRREAIEYALKIAKEADTVLLCGKGQETYQIIGKKKYHFDEREVVKEILEKELTKEN